MYQTVKTSGSHGGKYKDDSAVWTRWRRPDVPKARTVSIIRAIISQMMEAVRAS